MMNNTRPSFYLISSAVDGNVNAIEKILALYDPYISKCCLRPFYDKYGNVCIVVDMELKGRIRGTVRHDLSKRKRATHAVIRERLLEKSFCHDLSSQNNDTSAWCGSAHKNGNS